MPLITFVAEDSEIVLDALIQALERLVQARVIGTATTAADSIAWLVANAEEWDLAVIDLYLNQGTGLEILTAVAERLPWQRVAILAIDPADPVRETCLSLGANAVFDKSTQLESFIEFCGRAGKSASTL
ncbi:MULTISPECIES: response regulator [unclassified Variovorax]|uniref:response regulator n=1 Tax=unclassified Variovorax TaxID=663243 RepID=UPI001316F5F0|nr:MULTISPECIES: response regulator [unclassified Variovorax]VTU14948.1 Response regulator of citrate/malate metabolism [Variovorax sp. SRS16]VTU22393.1 Response regulator of citrate/malate metabolism [Variovorax sp. PBL-E5]